MQMVGRGWLWVAVIAMTGVTHRYEPVTTVRRFNFLRIFSFLTKPVLARLEKIENS
jgi:hypothetical protein